MPPHDGSFVCRRRGRGQLGVELVGLGPTLRSDPREVGSKRRRRFWADSGRTKAQPKLNGLARGH